MGDVIQIVVGLLQGILSSSIFILVLFIGFCTLVGFTKMKKTAGGGSPVIKSLDEVLTRREMVYLGPNAPRGPADQLRAPELVEAAARK
jgi:hypothetical protein